MTKIESAQLACEKVLNGIEDDTITTTSALLQCLKIARLLNDVDAIIWLQYEYGGYPKDKDGVHNKNKLSAVIEKLEDRSPSKSMVGSNVIYLLDWMDNLTELQCKGVHHEVTRRDATRCIIQTYICLGDILSLQDE